MILSSKKLLLILKSGEGLSDEQTDKRTDNMCEYSDHYHLGLFGLVEHQDRSYQ